MSIQFAPSKLLTSGKTSVPESSDFRKRHYFIVHSTDCAALNDVKNLVRLLVDALQMPVRCSAHATSRDTAGRFVGHIRAERKSWLHPKARKMLREYLHQHLVQSVRADLCVTTIVAPQRLSTPAPSPLWRSVSFNA